MNEEFEDISIIGKPDSRNVKVGSKSYTRIFAFSLSSAPPQRWNELLIQEWTSRIMQSPRPIWIKNKELVIDCRIEELPLIIERLGVDMQIVNRKYHKEMENTLARTNQQSEQAVEDKRIDEASIKKILEELTLPVTG
jgi:hypothetical protein